MALSPSLSLSLCLFSSLHLLVDIKWSGVVLTISLSLFLLVHYSQLGEKGMGKILNKGHGTLSPSTRRPAPAKHSPACARSIEVSTFLHDGLHRCPWSWNHLSHTPIVIMQYQEICVLFTTGFFCKQPWYEIFLVGSDTFTKSCPTNHIGNSILL